MRLCWWIGALLNWSLTLWFLFVHFVAVLWTSFGVHSLSLAWKWTFRWRGLRLFPMDATFAAKVSTEPTPTNADRSNMADDAWYWIDAETPSTSTKEEERLQEFVHRVAPERNRDEEEQDEEDNENNENGQEETKGKIPVLNIVMLVVGSVGDIQPFVALALEMQRYGHRIRFATHRCFEKTVRSTYGLDFFPLGGDPQWMMDYMVRCEGQMVRFSRESLFQDLPASRRQIADVLRSTWDACHSTPEWTTEAIVGNPPSFALHVAEKLRVPFHSFFTMPWTPTVCFMHPFMMAAKENPVQQWIRSGGSLLSQLFSGIGIGIGGGGDSSTSGRGDDTVIKSTRLPPCCISTTTTAITTTRQRSWSFPPPFGPSSLPPPTPIPTFVHSTARDFVLAPSPLPSPSQTLTRYRKAMHWYSYLFVEQIMFTGLMDLINDFRTQTLKLRPLGITESQLLHTRKVPTSYMWSRCLFPKPSDWDDQVEITGFCRPPETAVEQEWVLPDAWRSFVNDCKANGEFVVFVGFGSCVIRDIDTLVATVVQAAEQAGCRLILQSNWTSFVPSAETRKRHLFIGQAPHVRVFELCDAVCHHGGAGTVYTGLRAARPTIVVPFFGDQFFWGDWVRRFGVGPGPVPYRAMKLDALRAAFRFVQNPRVRDRALMLSRALQRENGAQEALRSFHRQLRRNGHAGVVFPSPAPPVEMCFRGLVELDMGGQRTLGSFSATLRAHTANDLDRTTDSTSTHDPNTNNSDKSNNNTNDSNNSDNSDDCGFELV